MPGHATLKSILSALTLGLVALAPGSAVAADGCKLIQAASLPLSRPAADAVTLPVLIGGKEVPFALNTGSVVSFITPDAAALGYSTTVGIDPVFVSGGRIDRAAIVPMLTLGGLVGTAEKFVLIPPRAHASGGAEGEIGLDKLEAYDVELDLAHDKINLFQRDHCKGQVVYWTSSAAAVPFDIQPDGQINIPMELDGKPVNVLIDTTQATSEIGVAALHRLFGFRRGDFRPAAQDESGDYRGSFQSLDVGGLVISHPDVAIFDYGDAEAICDGKFHVPPRSRHFPVPYRCYGGGDMRIGLKQLRALRLFIAFSEKMLYITPADAR